jgi:[ribosomal protein S18]-alanine N-acetyltransferase
MSALPKDIAPKSQLHLRPMQMADLDAISEIEPQVYSHPWSRGNFSDSLNAGYSCWAYEDNGILFGYAVLMTVLDEAHLLNISIAKSHQGQSLGRNLLEHMMQIARKHGAQNIFLEVRPSNTAAVRLYESIGFNEMAIRRNYYPAIAGREDAILMGMAL